MRPLVHGRGVWHRAGLNRPYAPRRTEPSHAARVSSPSWTRLRQDIAARSSGPTRSEAACREARHSWRERTPRPRHHRLPVPAPGPPRQHRLPARRPLRRLGLHRQRLLPGPQAAPPGRLPTLLERVAATLRSATAEGAAWLGHRVWIIDGSSFSMPDVPELQRHFGQPAGSAGLRLPRGQVAGPVRPRDRHAAPLGAGARADPRHVAGGPASRERAGARRRGAGRSRASALMRTSGDAARRAAATAVFRIHQKQFVDFTPGRPLPTSELGDRPAGPAALALGAGPRRLGPGGGLVQAEAEAARG